MAVYKANVSFDHAGVHIEQGRLIEDDDYLYTMFPTRFTVMFTGGTAVTDQSGGTASAGGTIGTIIAGTADATSAGLTSTQNAVASLAAAIARINTRLDQA